MLKLRIIETLLFVFIYENHILFVIPKRFSSHIHLQLTKKTALYGQIMKIGECWFVPEDRCIYIWLSVQVGLYANTLEFIH